jgi:hypothetical protein
VHETTVRFSDELWARVQQASRREGTSAAHFVREATIARVAVETQVAGLRRDVYVVLGRFDVRLRRMEATLRRHGLR